jgi:hypothetical protein
LQQSTQLTNIFSLSHNYRYSPSLSVGSGIFGKLISDDISYQEFNQYTLEIFPEYTINSLLLIRPMIGGGMSKQKKHNDPGTTWGVNLSGFHKGSDERNLTYSLNTRFEKFGSRDNRIVNTNAYWVPIKGRAAADSISAGYFFNYYENYVSTESMEIEASGKGQQYITNYLRYRLSPSSTVEIKSQIQWRNLDRSSALQSERRNEFALENHLFWKYSAENYSYNLNIRFRNEQKRGSNTAINVENRFTAIQFIGENRIWDSNDLYYRLYLSKYESDTPTNQQLDRDELRWGIFGSYRLPLFKTVSLLAQMEIASSHQLYLYSQYSNNNYENRIYSVLGGIDFHPSPSLRNVIFSSLETNYNIFDFEELDVPLRSRLVKSRVIGDTLSYRFGEKSILVYVGMFHNIGLGNFDPREILFYRNQNRLTQRHKILYRYRWSRYLLTSAAFTYYSFAQLNATEKNAPENKQFNLIPQFELSFIPGNMTRILFRIEFNNNTITSYGTQKNTFRRDFIRANIDLDYTF